MVEELRAALAADPLIAYALLFGSHARGTAHAGSDVDLAIGILPGTVLTPLDLGQIVSITRVLESRFAARAPPRRCQRLSGWRSARP
jgi:predicted nucleotidyltransferase